MSVGDVAGLIAAGAFVLLVGFMAVPLLKLGRVLDETRVTIRGLSDDTRPLIGEVTTTVSQTNHQLERSTRSRRTRRRSRPTSRR